MKIDNLNSQIAKKLAEINRFKQEDVPEIIGTEAVNYYGESFDKEAFEGKKWEEVERRKPTSPWYGTAGGEPSSEALVNPILTGKTSLLRRSLTYQVKSDRVTVGAYAPYAAVHQYGLQAKIFGKTPFTMPARPFIGKSDELKKNITDKIERELQKIINKK